MKHRNELITQKRQSLFGEVQKKFSQFPLPHSQCFLLSCQPLSTRLYQQLPQTHNNPHKPRRDVHLFSSWWTTRYFRNLARPSVQWTRCRGCYWLSASFSFRSPSGSERGIFWGTNRIGLQNRSDRTSYHCTHQMRLAQQHNPELTTPIIHIFRLCAIF